MPVYEYECNKCGHCFEFLVIRRDEQPECEKCGSQDLRRLLSSFATSKSERSESSSCPTGTCPTGTCSLK
jgi:putative FmdB family regulatory protein